MYRKVTIHSGLMEKCKQCTPDMKEDRRELKLRRFSTNVPAEIAVRRQVSAEIEEEDVPREHRYILLQKYGVIDPVIDRRVQKPSWMEKSVWNQKINQWFVNTKGLAQASQRPRNKPYQKPNLMQSGSRPQGTKIPSRNYGPTNRATRPY